MDRRRGVRTGALLASIVLLATIFVSNPAVATSRTPTLPAISAPLPAAACWERDYTYPANDAAPDALSYSLKFDCPSRFTLTVSFDISGPYVPNTDYLRFWVSTGAAANCNGADRMVAGQLTSTGPVGTVYRTPSCDTSTWSILGPAGFIQHDLRVFLLGFDAATLGTASFRWWVESRMAVSGAARDRLPDSGSQVASGVPYYPNATSGYWLIDTAGVVHFYGTAAFFGDLGGRPLAAPIVGMGAVPNRSGYWLLGRDGGVFSFGSAQFYGSTGGIHLNQPIQGLTATHTGHGYWFVASDGGIFSYGDASFYGSTGAIKLNRPIVGMAATPTGHGYWLVASDGGIFSFGDARFFGSTGAIRLNRPIVGMAPTKSGHGYWLVASDGGIFSFGDAHFHGSTGNLRLARPIVGMTVSPTGNGYRFAASDGGIFSFGDAPFYGSLAGTPAASVVGIS